MSKEMQLELFGVGEDCGIDKRQEFIQYGKFFFPHVEGWQDAVAMELIKNGDFVSDISALPFVLMYPSEASRLGVIIRWDKSLYRDKVQKISKPDYRHTSHYVRKEVKYVKFEGI